MNLIFGRRKLREPERRYDNRNCIIRFRLNELKTIIILNNKIINIKSTRKSCALYSQLETTNVKLGKV